jgi:hypothetical protein
MQYRPRRSSKRWLVDAPEFILACYDNKGKTTDRYTVLFGGTMYSQEFGYNVQYLAMSNAPTNPQGVSMWGEMPVYNRKALGYHIRWLDLPEKLREHVIDRATNDD